jgi:hypothetical protein
MYVGARTGDGGGGREGGVLAKLIGSVRVGSAKARRRGVLEARKRVSRGLSNRDST